MRLEIPEKVNKNCHVFRLGWTYPLCMWSNDRDFQRNVTRPLNETFGEPAKQYHFQSQGPSYTPYTKKMWVNTGTLPLERRYYAGSREWGRSGGWKTANQKWVVFRTEADRTLALLILG